MLCYVSSSDNLSQSRLLALITDLDVYSVCKCRVTYLIVVQHTTAKASDIATFLYRFSCLVRLTSLFRFFAVIALLVIFESNFRQ